MGFFWPRVNSQRNLMSNFYLGSNLKIWFAWRNSNEISNLVKIKLKVLVDFFNFCNQWYEFDFSFRSYLQHWFACLSPFLELQNLKDTTEQAEEFQRNLSVAQDYKSKLQDMVISYIFNTARYCQLDSNNSSTAANILFYKLNNWREFKNWEGSFLHIFVRIGPE